MRQHKYLPALWTLAFLLLSACGGGGDAPEPVESYAAGIDNLPALNQLVTLDDKYKYETTVDDSGVVTFHYEALTSGKEVAQAYAEDLVNDQQCVLLDEEGQLLPEGQEFEDTGTVVAAKESETGSGLFQLSISWDETSCTISPKLDEEAELPQKQQDAMTLEEAVSYLQSLSPSSLGLEGSDMSGYLVFPEEGLAVLDGTTCLSLNVYTADTHQYVATYLIGEPGRQVYQLNRDTGEATLLLP